MHEVIFSLSPQNGKDRSKCVDLLAAESDRLSHGGPLNRRFSLQNSSRSSLISQGMESSSSSSVAIPTLVVTSDEEPKGDDEDVLLLGHASTITAICLDVNDRDDNNNNNNNNNNEDDGGGSSSSSSCSLSTTTLSHGELRLLRCDGELGQISACATTSFATITRDTISVSRGSVCSDRDVPKVTKSSTKSTIFWNKNNNHNNNDHARLCPENPFRKVFAKRKEFYQTLADRQPKVSSVNRLLLRKRHCTLCCAESRGCAGDAEERNPAPPPAPPEEQRFTLDADIQPFLPFTITHDGEDPADSKSGGEVRYAASAINSEDGVESHLEVSVGADGSSVITTRHKRLGSPSEIANNSVLQLRSDGEGGRVLKIQHSTLRQSSSAHCTRQTPTQLAATTGTAAAAAHLLRQRSQQQQQPMFYIGNEGLHQR